MATPEIKGLNYSCSANYFKFIKDELLSIKRELMSGIHDFLIYLRVHKANSELCAICYLFILKVEGLPLRYDDI